MPCLLNRTLRANRWHQRVFLTERPGPHPWSNQVRFRPHASRPPYQGPREPKPAVPVPANQQAPAFGTLERQIVDNLASKQLNLRDDWTQVEGCWVLGPPNSDPPKAVVHFIGGAFVGAAPQLSYRALLEALAARGLLIVAVPFATGFNHLRIADEVHFKLERCMRAVAGVGSVPVFGLGHSMGSLIHLLIATQYPVQRAGNVLMSFNNKDVLEAIPFFAPFIAPGARALGPILSQLAASPLRSQVEAPLEILRGLSPGLVRQFLPILDQLLPIYLDVANGKQEFTPSPTETRRLIQSSYGVPRNLLLQFEDDKIDETGVLAETLNVGSAVSSQLELSVKVLPGDHIQPLLVNLGSLPPELASVVSQGNQFLEQFGNMAAQSGGPMGSQVQDFAKNLSGFANSLGGSSSPGAAQVAAIELLAGAIDEWLEAQARPRQPLELPPPPSSRPRSQNPNQGRRGSGRP